MTSKKNPLKSWRKFEKNWKLPRVEGVWGWEIWLGPEAGHARSTGTITIICTMHELGHLLTQRQNPLKSERKLEAAEDGGRNLAWTGSRAVRGAPLPGQGRS